uniref:RBR-type E3 ubiquitin transferase n=1 Tax=Chenopodium quinoa TaxID=63459 RepID=A0A803MFJ5_CHEQI
MESDDDNLEFYDNSDYEEEEHDYGSDSDTGNYSSVSDEDESNVNHYEVAASKLLYYYKWNVSQLHDQWFADEHKVRDEVCLPSAVVPFSTTEESIKCGICFDVLPREEFYPVVCGHPYCKTCWRGYITTSINDGPGCLSLRCPEPSCRVAVCRDLIDDLGTEVEREKYHRYYLRAYVEESRKIKWCPMPGCENAVELELGNNTFDVTCLCFGSFCWNCGEDAHRPVNCETVSKWVLKNSSEAENTKWILANSKPCPMCKRNIEKNKGCMHMVCSPPCKYQFCWLCLGDWKKHSKETGGFYACNIYRDKKEKGLLDEEESIREMARSSLNKYAHYYERWTANQKSREKAIEDFKALDTGILVNLRNKTNETEGQLKFIAEAWEQIIECRRVLKWTYAYGYYLPEDEHVKKQLFEYLQGQAEAQLEKLHNCTEKELKSFLEKDDEDFRNIRAKLVGLTAVTQSYFTKLVAYFETQKL